MHILYLSALGGGLDTYVQTLGPALARAGHRISVLYLHFPGAAIPDVQIDGCTVHHATIGSWHYYLSRAMLGAGSLPLVVRAFESSIALAAMVCRIHQSVPLDLVEIPDGMVPFHRLPVPYSMRLHGAAWLVRRLCAEPSPWADTVEAGAAGRAMRRAAGISSPSRNVAEYVQSACRLQGGAIDVIPYPIDTDDFKAGPEERAGGHIQFVGRVERRKGAAVLISALPRVWAHHPDVRCLLAGRMSNELQALAAKHDERIEFLGVTPRAELIGLYQRAKVFVMPSYYETFGIAIGEAMACATPVIASRIGGIPELVEEGRTGRLVPPGDERALASALVALLSNGQERRVMGKRAREKVVAEFSLPKILEQTLNFYQRVLAGQSAA